MIWLIAVPFIGYFTFRQLIASGFPGLENDPRGFLGWVFCILVGLFLTGLISLVPFAIASILGSNTNTVSVKVADYPLVALREKDGVSGNFFLGSGYVGDEQYYFWYRRDSDHIEGGKTRRESSVRIYERDGTPIMRTWKSVYKSTFVQRYGWLYSIDLRHEDTYSPDFFIPRGSIKEGFQL